MKRIAFSLMALALTGAVAFAQDAPAAKVGGYVNSGIKVVKTDDATTVQQYANDAGVPGYRGKLTGSVAADNFGVNVTIEKDATTAATVDGAYGWVNLMEGLKLEAGSTNSNPLGELDDNGKGYFGAAGLAAEYSMNGLTVGALANPGSTATKTFTYIAGARYALDKVATFNLTLGNEGNDSLNSLYATVSVSAIENLTLTAGYNSTGIADTASTFYDVKAGYAVSEALSAGAIVYYYSTKGAYYSDLTVVPVIESKAGITKFKPYVSYALGNGLTASAYLQGDTDENPNYEPQAELDFAAGGATVKTQVYYDTNASHADKAAAKTTLETDLIFSF